MKLNYEIISNLFSFEKHKYILSGGDAMYNYRVTDNVTKEVMDLSENLPKKKKIEEIVQQLQEINNKFSVKTEDLPVNIELERLTFEDKTPEQINEMAEKSLQEYKNSQINNITNENENKKKDLIASKDVVTESVNQKKENLQNYFETAKQNASDEALKRGLARSSIIINQLNAFDNKQVEDFKKLDEELTTKIDAINFELQGLSSELDKALSDFNISYAVKLQDKINSLNTELANKKAEVTKYNNEIALKEAEYNKKVAELKSELESDRLNKEIDIAELYGKYGSGVVNKVIQDTLQATMKNYLSSMSKEEIAEILNNAQIKGLLGNSVYNALVKEFGV